MNDKHSTFYAWPQSITLCASTSSASLRSSCITVRGGLAFSPRARVQRGPSDAARCASTGNLQASLFSLLFLYSSSVESYWREWPRLPSTARIGRALFHRARSASKEGTWSLPLLLLHLNLHPPYNSHSVVTPWLSDSFSSFRDSAQVRRRNQISHEN